MTSILDALRVSVTAGPNRTAFECALGTRSFRDLWEDADQARAQVSARSRSGTVRVSTASRYEAIVELVACWMSGYAPLIDNEEDLSTAIPDGILEFSLGHRGAIAYWISTTGTTGVKKWICIGAEAITAQLHVVCEDLSVGPGDRSLALMPSWVHPMIRETFVPLIGGATVLVESCDSGPADHAFASGLSMRPSLVLSTAPSTLRRIARLGSLAPSVRGIVLWGESASYADLYRGARSFPRADFWSHFGPTETLMYAHRWRWDGQGSAPVPVPIAADASGVVVKPLAASAGELVVEGNGVALAVCTSGSDVRELNGVYGTGDIVHMSQQGPVYLGRQVDAAAVTGDRLDQVAFLAEVKALELSLLSERDVSDCAILFQHGVLNIYLDGIAWCEIPQSLCGLPVRVERSPVPRTLAGKVDRKALLRPDFSAVAFDV